MTVLLTASDLLEVSLCGSGFQAAITAAQHISLGEADVCLTGGAEAMSMAPYTLSGAAR
jgi:acetyl-CoA acyltransferase 2